MKQKDKDLLLRDLCARLPYGARCTFNGGRSKLKLHAVKPYYDNCVELLSEGGLPSAWRVEDVTPYLRPLLSMTEKEKKELSARWLWTRCLDDINLAYLCDSAKDYVACSSGEYFELQDWLNAHHFDYRGLIGKGLALEAPKGMYIYN